MTAIRILALLLALLAMAAAALQYNDPDPWLWILVYSSVAMALLLRACNRPSLRFSLLVAGCCLALMVWNGRSVVRFFTNDEGISWAQGMSNEFPWIEETREFGGALFGLLAMFLAGWPGKQTAGPARADTELTADQSRPD